MDMDMDLVMYELDMERMYEDDSFVMDGVNADLQLIAQEQQEAVIEAAYDEMLDSIMQLYYPQYEEFDF